MRPLTALMLLLMCAVIASAVGVVVLRQDHRQLFVEMTALERERDALQIDYGRLQLEQATWADSGRIERIAREKLGMLPPEPESIVVLRP